MTRTGRGCIILAALALLFPGTGAAASSGDNALSSFYEVHAGALRIVHRAFTSAFGKPAFCPPGNEIISLRKVSGGGMRGGFFRFEIEKTPEGAARIIRDVREWHSAPQEIKIYEADISYLPALRRSSGRRWIFGSAMLPIRSFRCWMPPPQAMISGAQIARSGQPIPEDRFPGASTAP